MRINVTISDEMNEKLEEYGKRYGMSKSSIIGFVLGQWLDNIDRMNKAVYGVPGTDGMIAELLKKAVENGEK